MDQEGHVTAERQGHVLLMGLDCVAKRNAIDRAMLNALGRAYAELEEDDQLRCGVLFAHGERFTAGYCQLKGNHRANREEKQTKVGFQPTSFSQCPLFQQAKRRSVVKAHQQILLS